jgi:hypothetical protein
LPPLLLTRPCPARPAQAVVLDRNTNWLMRKALDRQTVREWLRDLGSSPRGPRHSRAARPPSTDDAAERLTF